MKFSLPTANSAILQAAYENEYDFISDFLIDSNGKELLGGVMDPKTGDTLLHIAINKFACNQKDDALLKLISKIHNLFNIENNNKQRPLELAAAHGLWDFILQQIAFLKESGAWNYYNGPDSVGLSNILMMAAKSKMTLIVYKLLNFNANPNLIVNNQSALSIFSDQHDWLSARIFLNPKAVQKEHWQIQTVLACVLYSHFIQDSIFKDLPYDIINAIFDCLHPNISSDFYNFIKAKEKYASAEWTEKLDKLRAERTPAPAPAPSPTEIIVHTVSNTTTPVQESIFAAPTTNKPISKGLKLGMKFR